MWTTLFWPKFRFHSGSLANWATTNYNKNNFKSQFSNKREQGDKNEK